MYTVHRVIKSKQGNGHILSWSPPQRFTPPVEHDCPYIYTIENDTQIRSNVYRVMMKDIRAREDDEVRLQARAWIASMVLALGLVVLEVPGDGNCFSHAARFVLLQRHGWNYDLIPLHQVMRAHMCLILRENRDMLDVNELGLNALREGYIDLRPEPSDGTVLEPPRLSYYDTWEQWVNEMERPNAYVDNLLVQDVSYVYGVCIRLLCDSIWEPVEFYPGPGKPLHSLMLTFRSGGMYYSATRPISTTAPVTSHKRKHEYAKHISDEGGQQGNTKPR